MPVEITCQICGKTFFLPPSKARGRKFCSTKCRDISQRGRPAPSEQELRQLYFEDKLALRAIAKRLQMSHANVRKWFIRYNIKRRNKHCNLYNKRRGKGLKRAYREGRRKAWMEGKKLSEDHKRKISKALKGNKRRVGLRPANAFPKGYTPWNKGNESPWFKELIQDPEFQRKRLEGLLERPTKPEARVIQIIQRYGLPYRYVGDGKVVIEGLCPDFIGNNGIKRIIEVFGDVFHNPDKSFKEVPYHLTEEGRKKFFAEHGFDTLILWVSEMNKMSNSEIAQAIIKFKVEV